MAILDKINLDFQLYSKLDPKVLIIMDTSVWGAIEDKTAAIEIMTPGSTKVRRFNYVKNKTNVFNSSNLFLSHIGEYKDLADGIYRVDIFGAHGHCKHRDILKTDKAKLELYKMYASLGRNNDEETKRKKSILQDINTLIKSAEILVSGGNLSEAMYQFKQAVKDIKNYNECETCK